MAKRLIYLILESFLFVGGEYSCVAKIFLVMWGRNFVVREIGTIIINN